MNRKKAAKETKRKPHIENPLDDMMAWLETDLSKPPLDAEWQADFQKKLDSAFGAKDAIVLAWSGDQKYWNTVACDWFSTGTAKQWEKKPIVLFGCFNVSETDYIYVSPPRWLLLERRHPAQYAATWEQSAWIADARMLSNRKRFLPEQPPKAMYEWLRTIAEHDQTIVIGDMPRCCRTALDVKKVCYGRYKPPSEIDIAYVRGIREKMDRDGLVQRNDEPVNEQSLKQAKMTSKFYHQQAERQQSSALKDFILSNPRAFLGAMPQRKGITLSDREITEAVKEALDQSETERFGESKAATI
jgi:hypothetical protein